MEGLAWLKLRIIFWNLDSIKKRTNLLGSRPTVNSSRPLPNGFNCSVGKLVCQFDRSCSKIFRVISRVNAELETNVFEISSAFFVRIDVC
jgi:hypothetical protein